MLWQLLSLYNLCLLVFVKGCPRAVTTMCHLFGIAHDILGFWLLDALDLGLSLGVFQSDLSCDTEIQPFFILSHSETYCQNSREWICINSDWTLGVVKGKKPFSPLLVYVINERYLSKLFWNAPMMLIPQLPQATEWQWLVLEGLS